MADESKREDRTERTDADELSRAIHEELADHLAQAASEFARGGQSPDDAARLALKQFGDVRRTVRQCLWIQQGDQVMRRTVLIGLVVVFVLVAAGFVFPFVSKLRRGQQALADDIQRVVAEIKLIHATQQELLGQKQAEQVLEIKGRAYLGDPSKPAAGAEIQLLRMPSMEIYRRLRTRQDGTFTSEALPPGDYALLAELVDETNWTRLFIQSKPIYEYRGVQLAVVDLDLHFPAGQVSLDLSRALPDANKVGDYRLSCDFRLHIQWTSRLDLPLSPSQDVSTSVHWPIIGSRGVGTNSPFTTWLSPNTATSLIKLNTFATSPAPRGGVGPYVGITKVDRSPHKAWWPEGRYRIMTGLNLVDGDGKSLLEDFQVGFTQSPEFDVREGQRVNLRLHVPEALGPQLRELLAKAKDERSEQEIKQVRDLLPRIEIVSTEPIPEPSAEESAPQGTDQK